MYRDALERLRSTCRSLPQTSERLSHGAPTFFVKEKKAFVMLMNDHHRDGRLALWCAAAPGAQQALNAEAPAWFFVPPYVGPRGWIGIRLDRGLAWDAVAEFVIEAYCAVAPPALVALLEANIMKKEKNMEGMTPYLLQAGEGVAGSDASVKASRVSTGGHLTVIESHTKGGAPLHVHTREDEYFYVLEGTLIVRCGEETFEAGPRSFVFLPRNIPHSWDVRGEEGATLLMLTVPAMLEEFLHEYHAATGEDRDRIAAKYGITFLPEPDRNV